MKCEYVYLDLKDWIELGKDFHKVKRLKATTSIELECLLESVATGKMCFPLVDTLFLEFFKNGNRNRRARLAEMMATLSLGYVIADKRTRLTYEIRNAFSNMLKRPTPVNREMVVRGLSRALISDEAFSRLAGLNPSQILHFNKVTDRVDAWVDYFAGVSEETRTVFINKFRESNKRHTHMLESFRNSNYENPDMMLRIYYTRLLFDNQSTLEQVMNEFGLSKNDFLSLDGMAFSSEIPSYEIEAKLTVESMKQKTRRLSENDLYDISSLAGAIPHCDTVVTEAFWVDLCKRLGFDNKYNCKFLTKYKQLFGEDHIGCSNQTSGTRETLDDICERPAIHGGE